MANEDRRGSGALTGATGSLTPDDVDEPFVPAEQREIADPKRAEERSETVEAPAPPRRGRRGTPRLGGDVRQEPEKEHM
jgi:hypothetical protein